MIVWVSVVLRKTVVGSGDWCFSILIGSHYQSQVNSCCQSNVWQTSWLKWLTSLHEPHLVLSIDISYSIESSYDLQLGCQNVSHYFRQQSLSELYSPRQSDDTIACYPHAQTICSMQGNEQESNMETDKWFKLSIRLTFCLLISCIMRKLVIS